MKEQIHDLLLRSLDSELTKEQQEQLNKALKNSESLRLELEQLKIMRQAITHSAAESFKSYFANRVMQRIRDAKKTAGKQEAFFETLMGTFRPMAFAAAILIIGILSYNIIKNKVILPGVLSTPEITLEEAFDPTLALIQE